MLVYGLIGRSGSGKSHRAQNVSRDNNIGYIIDDGLLINGNRVVAGVSAKRENTSIGAVKRAIFSDPIHRHMVADAIIKADPPSILILGTSENMLNKIIENLNLPHIYQKIFIEDIAARHEIDAAIRIRKEQGKHIIPVPTFAIKKDFSGYFIDSMKHLTRRGKNLEAEDIEKTVVRPTFSYLGKYIISDNVIKTLVVCTGEKVEGVYKILKVYIENTGQGLRLQIEVSIDYGCIIYEVVNQLRKRLRDEIEYMTAFNILEISVFVKNLNVRGE
jgi:uncharacterized alkaline shock family protein YloU